MSQQMEKEDPRQAPPKEHPSTQRVQHVGRGETDGGMRDDVSDARGAVDGGTDENLMDPASRSSKDDIRQRSAAKSDKENEGDHDRVGNGSSSGRGSSGSSGPSGSKR